MLNEMLHDPFALYYLSAALVAVPLARIFIRAGFKPFWIILLLVPDVGMIFCMMVLALYRWPKHLEKGKA